MNYSVLMSVYYKETAENLRQSMESMFCQTIPTNDFVLICDGPLNEELDSVISEFSSKYPDILNIIRLNENQGLGHALRIGVCSCKNEIIARMDSDDISVRDRCEKELTFLENNPDVSIVGSNVIEFSGIQNSDRRLKAVPEHHIEIIKYSKKRCPFNHPTVVYRKNDIIKAGNYHDLKYVEDYNLWFSLLSKGYKGYNIQEPLVMMRVDDNLFKRRSGKEYIRNQIILFKSMRNIGYISFFDYLISCSIRICSGILPNNIRKIFYLKFLRRKFE